MSRQGQSGKAEIISKEDLDKILYHLRPSDKIICLLCWFTTERIGAILQLPQHCIYDQSGQVRERIIIPKEIRKAGGGEDAQTREVFCHPILRDALKSYPRSVSDFMFPSPTDFTKFLPYSTFWRRFKAAVRLAALTNRRITSHSFRRSSITYLSRTGISLQELKEITGHKSISALLKYIEGDPLVQEKAILQLR